MTHRWVVLHVKEGDQEGYIKVSAGSLRNRLGIDWGKFYSQANEHKWDLTELTKTFLRYPIGYSYDLCEEGGKFLEGTEGKAKNEALAFSLFQKAAETGSPYGYSNMAYCYSHGKGVEQSSVKATEALKKMVDLPNFSERIKYSTILTSAMRGVKEIEPFIEDHHWARLRLGEAYLEGRHTLAIDKKKALELFEQLVSKYYSHPLLFECLARCYSLYPELADPETAEEALNRLIAFYDHEDEKKEESQEALKSLAKLYRFGVQELDLLCDKFTKVALLIARELLKYDPEVGSAIQSEKRALAVKLIQKATAVNDPEGYAAMAYIYSSGTDEEKDHIKAFDNIQKVISLIKTEEEAKKCWLIMQHGLFYL